MHQTDGFLLQYLNNIPYILPYGQGIAGHKRGIRVNETGATIWTLVGENLSRDEILNRLTDKYDADTADDVAAIARDLDKFLRTLDACGMIEASDRAETSVPGEPSTEYDPDRLSSKDADIDAALHIDITTDNDKSMTANSNTGLHIETDGHMPASIYTGMDADDTYVCNIPASNKTTQSILPPVTLRIGGLAVRLLAPMELLNDNLKSFISSDAKTNAPADLTVTVRFKADSSCGVFPPTDPSHAILHDPELCVTDCDDRYMLAFPPYTYLQVAYVTKDSTLAEFFITYPAKTHDGLHEEPCATQQHPGFSSVPRGETFATQHPNTHDTLCDESLAAQHPDNLVTLHDEFFHALRLGFLLRAAKDGIYAMHSASILYRGKAWLFAGRSGIGKSTHTRLWAKKYDVSILNGDLNLLAFASDKHADAISCLPGRKMTNAETSMSAAPHPLDVPTTSESDAPLVSGIPWCGTSGIYTTETHPLGGIILLRQDVRDFCADLSPDQKTLRISQRLISPIWTAPQLERAISFSVRLAAAVPVCRLHCTPNESAVDVMKEWIDRQS